MDACCNRESCSSWRKQKDEDGDEENHMPSSEYQIFYDCSSDRDRKCKHKRNKPQMNMNTVFNNMDNPDQFHKTLSEITMLTHSILKTLETSSGTRKIKRSASERKHCNCGLDKARDVHLERIAILADKFLKTFIEPCGDHIDQPRKQCDQCNSRCNKHYRKNFSKLERLPLISPFKPIELVVPIKVNCGKILRTSQDTERPKFPIKVSNTETHTIYARNCYSREELKESSSDLFLSLREDTSYFSCDDSEWIMEKYCSCESFERVSGVKLISDEKKMKITNATKPQSSTLSICVCMICKRPIEYCRCNKASISQTVTKRPETEEITFKDFSDDHTESQENPRLTLINVMDDFKKAKLDSPSSFTKCKKCGKTECMCKGSKPTLDSIPPLKKDYASTPTIGLCSKCGKEKCICKASIPQILETPQHVCNTCGNPIQKCICEKPHTSKTYKMDQRTELNLCKHCGKTLDKCFCEQPQTSKSCDFKSGLRSDVLLGLCMCNKSLAPDPDLMAKICGKCGKSIEKCSCEKPQSSKGTPSHLSICKCGSISIRRLSSESSSRNFKTVTTSIVCQCGFKPERCKCKKPSATIVSKVCSKCGLTRDKCVCTKDIPRHTCGKCGKTLENCICTAKPQTKEMPKKCACSLPKPPAPVLCNRCREPLEKCICKKAQSTQTVEVIPVEVIPEDRCTKCGKYPCVCPTYSSQGTQTEFKPIIIKPLCEICGKELENCYCKNAQSTQTEKPETVYFICDKCDAKKYVGPGQQPEPCECGKEIISNEKELQELLGIDKEVLEEDIIRCVCDLKEPQIEEPPKPEPPPKPPRKTYRLAFPQHKDIDICRKCRFEPSPLIDQDGRVFCPGNCGCCLCPWKPRASHSLEDTLKHTKFKICKCRTRGSIFTQFTTTDSECSQVSYFDACPCREKAEAKHLQLYGYEMWDMSEKLIQKFRGEEVYLRDVREIVPTKLPSKRYLTSRLYNEEFKEAIDYTDFKYD